MRRVKDGVWGPLNALGNDALYPRVCGLGSVSLVPVSRGETIDIAIAVRRTGEATGATERVGPQTAGAGALRRSQRSQLVARPFRAPATPLTPITPSATEHVARVGPNGARPGVSSQGGLFSSISIQIRCLLA